MQVLKIIVVISLMLLVFGVIIFNAIYMIVSPRAWFRLPEWMQISGSMKLKKREYSSGWGALQVRILGGLFLTFILWMIWEMIHGGKAWPFPTGS